MKSHCHLSQLEPTTMNAPQRRVLCSQNIVMFPWRSRNVPVMFLFSTWMNGQDQWKIAHHAAHQEGVVHCTLWKCPRWRGRSFGTKTSRPLLDLRAAIPIKLSKTHGTWVRFFTWFFPWSTVFLYTCFLCFSGPVLYEFWLPGGLRLRPKRTHRRC